MSRWFRFAAYALGALSIIGCSNAPARSAAARAVPCPPRAAGDRMALAVGDYLGEAAFTAAPRANAPMNLAEVALNAD